MKGVLEDVIALYEQNIPVNVERICAEHPELMPELKVQLGHLEKIDQVAELATSTTSGSSCESPKLRTNRSVDS